MSLLPRFTVLYDGGCPLCRRAVRTLARLDWFSRLTFADVTDDGLRVRWAPGLSREDALAEMYVVSEDGNRVAGFDGYLRLSRGLPVLWLFRLIGLLPPVRAMGRAVYRAVAARRTRHGACTDDVCAPTAAPAPFTKRLLKRVLLLTSLLAVAGAGFERLELVSFAQVDARWDSSVPDEARAAAAKRHSMYFLRSDDGTWQYALADTSRENVAALLKLQSVEIGLVDRVSGALTGIRQVSVSEWIAIRHGVDLTSVMVPASIAPLALFCLFLGLLLHPDGRTWLLQRVPEASPVAMGLYRAACAGALIVALSSRRSPAAELWFEGGLLLCFGLGVLPRLSLALFIATFASLNDVGDHDVNLPFKIWCLLLVVPWGDAPGLVSLWRRDPHAALRPTTSRWYGLAFWIPMFALGTAYLAGAHAKFATVGLEWITGGALRYFVAIDGPSAPGELWRTVAAHDVLPEVLSLAAVAVESTIILAALWYSPALAMVAGLAAVGLHGGFWLLQGIWWPFWWALLPAFLPWMAIAARLRRPGVASPRRVPDLPEAPLLAACALALFTGTQVVAALLQIERPPFLSNFAMYADLNWHSKDQFAEERNKIRSELPVVRIRHISTPGSASSADCRTEDERVARDIRDRRQPEGPAWTDMVACAIRLAPGTSPTRTSAVVEIAPARFDWRRVGFVAAGLWQQTGVLDLSQSRIIW